MPRFKQLATIKMQSVKPIANAKAALALPWQFSRDRTTSEARRFNMLIISILRGYVRGCHIIA
jgi:hypothetical protein